jgi:hypothetical protein
MVDFLCPSCLNHLRVGDHIIFRVKNGKKQTALILLSPHIGNYSSVKHPSFITEPGEALGFFCPVCNSALTSDIHANLAHVIMDENGKRSDIYFSRVSGEHSTFETKGDSVHISGEDAGRYTYFRIGEKFKKYF